MSLLNGFAALGTGLRSAGEDIAREEEAKETARASLLNNSPLTSQQSPSAATSYGDPSLPGPRMPTKPANSYLPGSPLDPATVARAHDVFLGLVDRGMDPHTALGFAANAVQESNANPATRPGDMGAAHGLMMWRDDRLQNYAKQFGHAPEQGNLNEHLDFIVKELLGPESPAWQKIQAAPADAASRAGAISQFYERPKDTAAEIARRAGIANQLMSHFTPTANKGVE